MHQFFRDNETIILFADGLMFFALGFAVWLQRRRATRLTLTSSLIWLAAFAFVESLAVWGHVFIPIQDKYLGPGPVEGLTVLRALIQTLAFLFLLQFGLRLIGLSSLARRALTAASVLVAVAILAGGALLAARAGWGVDGWERSVGAASRYAILLPGALISAVGLWRQRDELAAAGMQRIQPWVAAAAAVLVAYALFAGLVVDRAPWAPSGPANGDGWFDATGVNLAVIRGLAGLALCVVAVKLLEIFDVEAKQRLEALDRARAVAEERARFGRDLHDGTIQSLYAAGLHLETVAIRCDNASMRGEMRQVVGGLNRTMAALRDYIKALRQAPTTPEGIAGRLQDLTRDYASEVGLVTRFRAEGIAGSGPLPEEAGEHLEQILREALANIARHAGVCSADVVLSFAPDELDLVVRDAGAGLSVEDSVGPGQGLRNMRERARRLGGRLTIAPAAGGGTEVALAVPLDSETPAPDPIDLLTPQHEAAL